MPKLKATTNVLGNFTKSFCCNDVDRKQICYHIADKCTLCFVPSSIELDYGIKEMTVIIVCLLRLML